VKITFHWEAHQSGTIGGGSVFSQLHNDKSVLVGFSRGIFKGGET
jgi:hypothetical protein